MYGLGRGPHRRTHAGLWFAAFTIVSLLMLLASRTDQAEALQQVTARALDPLRAAVAGLGQGAAGLFGAIGEIDRLRSENDRLRRELAGAEQRIAALTEAGNENAELRGLLGLAEALEMELLPVRVISRDPSNITWEVGIDAGIDDGVREGMAVLGSAEGAGALAGTVVEAGDELARVRFIVDTRSSVIALDQQTRALGEIEGQLGGQLVFVNVPITEDLREGDAIVSAGLALSSEAVEIARSAYPKGLLIGHVQAIEPDPNALTQTGFVRPAIDFRAVERLLVVQDFSQD
jgi:rod shape-determining protein MreC